MGLRVLILGLDYFRSFWLVFDIAGRHWGFGFYCVRGELTVLDRLFGLFVAGFVGDRQVGCLVGIMGLEDDL